MAIGLLKDTQGCGYGRELLKHVEENLSNHRILIVETSGLDQFESTRQFYLRCGFRQEAVIRDYWSTGDDKVIFWKRLNN